MTQITLDTARRALGFISPEDRDTWVRMGMALKAEFGDSAFDMWDNWSQGSSSYNAGAAKASWKSFKLGGKVGIGSLLAEAKSQRFVLSDSDVIVDPAVLEAARIERAERDKKAEENRIKAAAAAAKRAGTQWRMAAKEGKSPYLVRKQVRAESCRFLADGGIIIPMLRYDLEPVALVGKQQIDADGSKKYSNGMDKTGAMCRLGDAPVCTDDDVDYIFVGEGYATLGSIRAALNYAAPAFVCFDTSGLLSGARILRALYPLCPVVFVADDDYLTGGKGYSKAAEAAAAIGNAWVMLPTFTAARRQTKKDESLPMLTDFNDLHCAEGLQVVTDQINAFIASITNTGVPPASDAALPDSPYPFLDEEQQPVETVADISKEALLFRFALIYGTTEIWDGIAKRKMKRSAFDAYVGKAEAKAWIENPKKKLIEKSALPTLVGGVAVDGGSGGGVLQEMLDNLTLLRGTETVWDMIGRQVMTLGAVRANYTPELTAKWQERIDRKTVEQKNLVFDPTQTVDLDTHVNIFFGWPLTPKKNHDLVDPIIELIQSLCSSEDNADQIMHFMLCWMALPLQQPGAKLQTALLVFGEKQGTGKSLLFDSILRPIYGEYGTTVGQHQLESGFTDWRSRKLFTLFEEVLSRDDKFSHNGTLKYMITGKRMQVNPKNLPLREENNHMNCVFLSNEPQPIPIELEDRRFLVIQARLMRDKEFYDRVVASINNGGLEAFYEFLLSYPLGDFNEHTKPPMTRAKERVISFGRASWDAFHFNWREGILDAPYCSCLTSDLYIVYKRWCDRNGEKPLSQTKFSGYLDSRETKTKKEISLSEKPKRSYMIFEIPRPEGAKEMSLHEQCTMFREKADVYGAGN